MKKIVYSTLFFAGMFLTTACSDYLEVGSPSIVDSDFVFSNPTTARAALDGAYVGLEKTKYESTIEGEPTSK